MKRFTLLVAVMLSLAVVSAKPVDLATAQRVAANVLQKTVVDATPAFFSQCYLFAGADGQGFVLVAASDCVRPLLAYSHTETFPTEAMPDNLRHWLDGYQLVIAATEEASINATPAIAAQWQQLIASPLKSSVQVEPLLTTRWRQSPYFNSLCPYDETDSAFAVTGCVATAMGQIMRFWSHPTTGMGSHSYYHPVYGWLSAQFDTTHYDWSHMPDTLNALNPDYEVRAIARLCSDAGVSVNMNYGTRASGAYCSSNGNIAWPSAENALKNHFRYSPRLYSVFKSDYSDSQWDSIMRNECDWRQPVLYSGYDPEAGGHAFVLDGYDSLGLFHINWGWGGGGNGYYTLDSLNPYSYSFSQSNEAIIGIRPALPVSDSLCTVAVTPVDNSMGTVEGSGTYHSGSDTVNIIARGNEGYLFSHWTSGSRYNPNSFIAYDDMSDQAVFTRLYGDTVSYCFSHRSSWHDDYSDTTEWGIRIPASTHALRRSLAEVQFYLVDLADHELRIYVGDSICDQTLAYETVIDDLDGSQRYSWVSHTLDTPLWLKNNATVWVTFRVVSPGYPAAMSRYSGNSDGTWYHLPDGWAPYDQHDVYYSWMIRALFEPTRKYNVAASPNDINMGNVAGMGIFYAGDTCRLQASPIAPYHFSHWSTGDSTELLIFTVTSDTLIIGYFEGYQGIGEVDGNTLSISLQGLTLTIGNPDGRPVALFDIMGRELSTINARFSTLTLPAPGVYLLRAEGLPTRRIVAVK